MKGIRFLARSDKDAPAAFSAVGASGVPSGVGQRPVAVGQVTPRADRKVWFLDEPAGIGPHPSACKGHLDKLWNAEKTSLLSGEAIQNSWDKPSLGASIFKYCADLSTL